jgi:hypothetical protein
MASWAFMWLCVAIAAGTIAYGYYFADRRFLGGAFLLLAAFWYYLSIRWVDRYGRWGESS